MDFRPITTDEVDTFLRLLCDVFELDFTRASSVFTSEPFFDLDRKWAAFEDGQMRAIMTTTPLEFGWGPSIGISGVATHVRYRGRGIAKALLLASLEHSQSRGESVAYLFAADPRLYLEAGFKVVDEVVRGRIVPQRGFVSKPAMPQAEVEAIYQAWAEADPARLRRDAPRWRLWQWHLRPCEAFSTGYVCHEVSVVREAIVEPVSQWPVAPGTEWIGLSELTASLGVPLECRESEALMLARGTDRAPHLFMTDQF